MQGPADVARREPVLLERERELGVLDEALERARSGSGALLVVEGPAGIGKSRLLESAALLASERGMRCLRGRGAELERELAFGVARQLLVPTLRELDAREREQTIGESGAVAAAILGPSGTGLAGVALDQVAQVDALYWLVYELCLRWVAEPGSQAALITVDDAQWSDASTLRLLMRLTLGLEALPIAIVVAVRTGEQAPDGLLDRLRYHPDARVLRPGELSEEAVALLVRERLGADAAPEFCHACATATGGNAFLVGELAESLRVDGLAPTAGAARRVAGMVPAAVLRSVLLRLARLPADSRALAQAAAMIGPDARLGLGAAVAQLSPPDADQAAEALLAAGLLRSADPLLFSHPLVADAVAAEVPQLARSRAHRRAAEQLAADGAANERVASHLRLTSPAGDPWVVCVLREAGVSALARGEALDAAILLERALGEPCMAADRSSLLVALSQAYAGSAAPQALASSAEWEQAIDDPRERARALQAMARLLFSRGDAHAAVQVSERGRAALRADDQLAGRILASQVACMYFVPGVWPATEQLLDELEGALQSGRWSPEPLLLAQLGTRRGIWAGESAERVRPLAEAMLSVAPDVGEVWQGDPSMAAALIFVGEYELAERMLQRMEEHARRTGSPVYAGMTAHWRAALRYRQGWIADAVLDARQAIDIDALGWSSETAWSSSVLAVARVELADLDGARDAIAIGMAGDHSSLPHGFMLHAAGEVALAAGDPEAALENFTDAGTHLRERYCLSNPAVVPWRTGAANALVALGERARARALAEVALAEARTTESPLAVGGALRAAAAASRGGQRIELLRDAVAVLAPSGAQLEHIRALCDLGAALRHARQTRAAREMLDRATVLSRQRGATATARRAQRELRLSGSRPSRGPDDQQATRLTPGERRVAELAAQDLSNARIAQRLFITLRTVESHLTQTYRKLGIRSRAGLARALIEIDDVAVAER